MTETTETTETTATTEATETTATTNMAPKSTGAIIGIIAVALVVLVAISAIGGNVAAAIMGPGEANNEEGPVAAQEQPTPGQESAQGTTQDAATATADPNAVAVVVMGQSIPEEAVTEYIASVRASMGLDTDEAWGEWMAASGYTPETVRDEVIEGLVWEQLMPVAAEELGVEVTQADIDEALQETKDMFESEEEYQQALADAGITEESYIQNELMYELTNQKIMEAALGDAADEDEDGSAFYAWLQNYKQLKGVQVNPMPEGLPYVIDMAAYAAAAGSNELDLDSEDLMLEDEDGNPVSIEDLEVVDEEDEDAEDVEE